LNIVIPNLSQLALIHFGSKNLSSMVREWAGANSFAPLESCARQVWAGHTSTFKDFPFDNAEQDISVLTGSNAYRFALELLTGLKSERVGENHVVRQFREKWEQFRLEHPSLESEMRTYMEALEKDTAQIRSKIVDYIIPVRYQKAVQIISGQLKGDKILVTGHMTKTGEPSDDTKETIQFLGNNRNGRPLVSEIAVTAVNADEAKGIYAWVKIQQNQKRIHPNIIINIIDKNDMGIAVEVYDRFYMTSSLGKHKELEAELMYAWEKRMKRDNTLTLLRGQPELRGNTSEDWVSMKLHGVKIAEDIWEMLAQLKIHNAKLVSLANEMIKFCCDSREAGVSPQYKNFKVDKADLSLQMPVSPS
jgi:hypothetical protein